MNGDRSNHQGRVKVAEKAALPSAVRNASGFPLSDHVLPSPPWGRGAGGEGVDAANAQGKHPNFPVVIRKRRGRGSRPPHPARPG